MPITYFRDSFNNSHFTFPVGLVSGSMNHFIPIC